MHRVGIDIGSVSVKVVVMDEKGEIVKSQYVRHKGRPLTIGARLLGEAAHEFRIDFVAATGTGAKAPAPLMGASFINEIVAVTKGISRLHPQTGAVIDIGGEDSKLIILEKGSVKGDLKVQDFSMNALCAAGTGAFLDQQASRLRFSIEEFSEIALRSSHPPRIAGRCTVFAKSDMIHLQQVATPDYEIVAGLCYALARSFKSTVAKGKDLKPPVAFIGGVAANGGMRRALMDVFALDEEGFFVPEYYPFIGAIGAVQAVVDEPALREEFIGVKPLEGPLDGDHTEEAHEKLTISPDNAHVPYELKKTEKQTKVYLGVDVGSISTNLVLLDQEKNIIAKRYLMTAGRPLEAVRQGLAEISEEVGDHVDVIGAGTTGSGRYLTADFIGADIVRNEITAQAEAAISIDPQVDTIFEIGGQDSKYISIDDGVIVDFEMNKACAAGTGSFLEEQAERLGISIKEEFGRLALGSEKPLRMGERCTVFIESDVVHHQQRGAKIEDIVGGLSYSIVKNYLNKVVGDRRIGRNVFFQGGTAFNQGVVAAFEKSVGGRVRVPPHHDVTGAIGAAILAMKEKNWEKSGFKGFDLSKRPYGIETFECKGCENLCEIRKVTVENESPLFYGSRCEKYDVLRRVKKTEMADLFALRDQLLHSAYDESAQGEPIGVPKIFNMWESLPFWKAFLTELGFSPIFSEPTNKKTIREGVENIITEACFPIKVAHGHVLNLLERGLKRIFIPSVINLERPSGNPVNTFACPYAQTIPYTVGASIDFDALGVRVETPIVFFGRGEDVALRNLIAFGRKIRRSTRDIRHAFGKALEAQETFRRNVAQAGKDVFSALKDGEKAMVIIGRPYNSADPGANLALHRKLADLGVQSIPLDMFPDIDAVEPDEGLDSMYWAYGQKILRAAKAVRERKDIYGIYVTNFGCGPDSFITHFFKRSLGGKPFLQLEIDEHSADAGMITRLEAFLDSIKNAKGRGMVKQDRARKYGTGAHRRTTFIPNMSDHSHGIAAAFRGCGVNAVVMDESDEETIYHGRKYTTGRECYPCILTTGDMVKTVLKSDFDPDRAAFFMPSGNGPCRFGQYNRFHRLVLDELGFHNVPIYAPTQDRTFYEGFHVVGGKFSRLAWRSVVATDLLIKMLHETRPYEVTKGETEKVYRQAVSDLSAVIENGNDGIVDMLSQTVQRFLAVDRKATPKPVVAILGEIYVRNNRFSNSRIIQRIEEFGGEVSLAPVSEWISYVNYCNRYGQSETRLTLAELLKLLLVERIQKQEEHRLEEIFLKHLKCGEEPSTKEVLKKASPYVHESFEGEAILTIGKAIDLINKGASGIINVSPFNCLPGTIASALLRLVQKRHGIPVINIAYDGQGETNITTRLEAFMYQVKEQSNR